MAFDEHLRRSDMLVSIDGERGLTENVKGKAEDVRQHFVAKGPGAVRPGTDDAPSPRRQLGEAISAATSDLSSAVYGSLLVTALVVIEMQSDAAAEVVGLSIGAAIAVFWLAHVWATLVDLRRRARFTRPDVLESALAELPMLLAAIPPVLALAVSRAVGATVGQAEGAALAVAVAGLFAWGLAAGRPKERGWPAAIVAASVDVCLGLAIVGLKAMVVH